MKTIDLHEIAYNEGLELVSTTTGMNGYPQNVNYALIGLDDFQQAETLVKKYPCLEIVTLQSEMVGICGISKRETHIKRCK
jgi:hypothetical protein